MKKGEIKLGETFQCGIVSLKCMECVNNDHEVRGCDDCFFWSFCCNGCGDYVNEITGGCMDYERSDKTSVCFIED